MRMGFFIFGKCWVWDRMEFEAWDGDFLSRRWGGIVVCGGGFF